MICFMHNVNFLAEDARRFHSIELSISDVSRMVKLCGTGKCCVIEHHYLLNLKL